MYLLRLVSFSEFVEATSLVFSDIFFLAKSLSLQFFGLNCLLSDYLIGLIAPNHVCCFLESELHNAIPQKLLIDLTVSASKYCLIKDEKDIG